MLILILLLHALLAVTFPVGRVAIHCARPFFFTGIHMLVAGLFFLGYHRVKHGWVRPTLSQGATITLAVYSFFTMYFASVFDYWGLEFVPAAKAAFIYSLSPFCVALLSYLVFGERMTRYKLLGMAIGLIGFAVMVINDAPAEVSTGGIWVVSTGEILVTLATIAFSIGGIAARQLVRVHKLSPVLSCGWSMVCGGLMALITSPLAGEVWNPVPVSDYYCFVTTFLIIMLCSNIIAYSLFFFLIRRYSVTLIYFANFTEVGFAAVLAWFFLGESLNWAFYVSSILVLFGIYIFYQDELRGGRMMEQIDQVPNTPMVSI